MSEWRSRQSRDGQERRRQGAIDAINADRTVPILVRQVKYLNNIVEQDHRAIKRVTRPMLNFKSFRAAGSVLAGIEFHDPQGQVRNRRRRGHVVLRPIFHAGRNGPCSLSGAGRIGGNSAISPTTRQNPASTLNLSRSAVPAAVLAERARDVARLFISGALRANRHPAGREPLVRSILQGAIVPSTTLTFTRESMLLEAPFG
jgi:hypothetical protein